MTSGSVRAERCGYGESKTVSAGFGSSTCCTGNAASAFSFTVDGGTHDDNIKFKVQNEDGTGFWENSVCEIHSSGERCSGPACASSSNNNCDSGTIRLSEPQIVCLVFDCENSWADCNVRSWKFGTVAVSERPPPSPPPPSPPPRPVSVGSCTTNSQCASGSCKGGFCCTTKGMTTGCTACYDSTDGDCRTCSSGYELSNYECVASSSASTNVCSDGDALEPAGKCAGLCPILCPNGEGGCRSGSESSVFVNGVGYTCCSTRDKCNSVSAPSTPSTTPSTITPAPDTSAPSTPSTAPSTVTTARVGLFWGVFASVLFVGA